MSPSHIRPTLRQLEYLVAVAEEKSFSRAAGRCHVTQPSLSNQIRQLELLLGQDVFERTSRGVLLTPTGADLVNIARETLESVDRFMIRSQPREAALEGSLKIGSVSTVTPYLMPQVIAELAKDFPRLEIELFDETGDRLKESLKNGLVDVLVMPLPTGLKGCEEIVLVDDPFVLIAPADSPLGDLPEPISFDVLSGAKLILLDDPHCLRGHALTVCEMANCSTDTTLHATSINALVQLVRRGLGATLLPAIALELEFGWLRDVRIKQFESPPPSRKIGIAWRKDSPRSADFSLLASVLMRHAERATGWQPARE